MDDGLKEKRKSNHSESLFKRSNTIELPIKYRLSYLNEVITFSDGAGFGELALMNNKP